MKLFFTVTTFISVVYSDAFVTPFRKRPNFLTTKSQLYSTTSELWRVERVDRISDGIDTDGEEKKYPNPLSLKPNIPISWFVDEDAAVAVKVQVKSKQTEADHEQGRRSEAFTLAGPRLYIHFDPKCCKAAIVTCGGLCPGLNTVIRELVMCLSRQYGVQECYGISSGYRGFKDPSKWQKLDEKSVSNLHNIGGTILGSSRGGHDTESIVDSLQEQGVNLLFVIGGDGTVRGAAKIAEAVKERGLEIAVSVVPKSIDNDIPLIDRTFGFETAVEAAREAIDVAATEADGFPLGLGVVKVMGRNSGFIAMHSTLGSRVVDLCLVPEVDFYLDGAGGIVDHLSERLLENDKAIVVIAEGAGQELMASMGDSGDQIQDASGNILLDDVGPWLAEQLKSRLNKKLKGKTPYNDKITIKYVDPSYMVRGVPPNTSDNLFCTQLAHNAVHGGKIRKHPFIH
jgi:6-phosphofructokinase 1